jgi:hypothetical protein
VILDSISLTVGIALGAGIVILMSAIAFIFHEWGHMKALRSLQQEIAELTTVAELSPEEQSKVKGYQGSFAISYFCPKCDRTWDSVDPSPSPIRYCPTHNIPMYPVSLPPPEKKEAQA